MKQCLERIWRAVVFDFPRLRRRCETLDYFAIGKTRLSRMMDLIIASANEWLAVCRCSLQNRMDATQSTGGLGAGRAPRQPVSTLDRRFDSQEGAVRCNAATQGNLSHALPVRTTHVKIILRGRVSSSDALSIPAGAQAVAALLQYTQVGRYCPRVSRRRLCGTMTFVPTYSPVPCTHRHLPKLLYYAARGLSFFFLLLSTVEPPPPPPSRLG
ncbi:hypothetical protein LY76DRAFT_339936 [Colletotrichum caudatum]|nr:hypothetical protein LY76DRAFT_339936 [Colletotrichum caudatum]